MAHILQATPKKAARPLIQELINVYKLCGGRWSNGNYNIMDKWDIAIRVYINPQRLVWWQMVGV